MHAAALVRRHRGVLGQAHPGAVVRRHQIRRLIGGVAGLAPDVDVLIRRRHPQVIWTVIGAVAGAGDHWIDSGDPHRLAPGCWIGSAYTVAVRSGFGVGEQRDLQSPSMLMRCGQGGTGRGSQYIATFVTRTHEFF
jgi:hypothetical protein